jgi:hypothetical protein
MIAECLQRNSDVSCFGLPHLDFDSDTACPELNSFNTYLASVAMIYMNEFRILPGERIFVNINVFWDVMLCSLVVVHGRFVGTYNFLLQGTRATAERNSHLTRASIFTTTYTQACGPSILRNNWYRGSFYLDTATGEKLAIRLYLCRG